MEEQYDDIGEILAKYPEITSEQETLLKDWANQNDNNRKIFEELTSPDYLVNELQLLEQINEGKNARWRKVQNAIAAGSKEEAMPVERKIVWWNNWKIYAAASIIILAFIGFKWFGQRGNGVSNDTPVLVQNNNVAPGQFKAKLTLSDNKVIVLDSATDKVLLEQAGIRVINKDGQLVYEQTGKSEKVLYNTLTTARGQTYATLLSDGTKVWLNSLSSIRYPMTFNGDVRMVEVTGEVYFEVAPSITKRAYGKEGKQPFIVKAPGMEIEVLGTHFNVKSYNDEDVVKTTLVEGKVKVHSEENNSQATLIPGEQAQLNKISQILKKTNDVDVDAEVAWRFGYFNFSNSDFETLMRQLQRWYDVEVVYQGEVPDVQFFGKIPRAFNLSQVLNTLHRPGIQFKVVDKKIIVSP